MLNTFLGSEIGELYIWDLIEVKLLTKLKAFDGQLNAIQLAHNGAFVVTCGDRFIKIWEPIVTT